MCTAKTLELSVNVFKEVILNNYLAGHEMLKDRRKLIKIVCGFENE